MDPDPWQIASLRSTSDKMLFLCSRQSGKSLTAGAIAVQTALLMPDSLTLVMSPTERQSGELFTDKIKRIYNGLGRPIGAAKETALTLTLENGARIISLPGEESTVRGYSGAALIIIDEASKVPDQLYKTVSPIVAVSNGRLIAMSTPFGKRGWFYERWIRNGGIPGPPGTYDPSPIEKASNGSKSSNKNGTGGEGSENEEESSNLLGTIGGQPDDWERILVTADQCPRITRNFLEEERISLGERWWLQEYFCSFQDTVGAVFSERDIQSMLNTEVKPLFL